MKNFLGWIKSKKLTGVSTPFFGISWDDRKKAERKFNADHKLQVFISSICNDRGKYDKVRKILKQEIEATGLAEVYLFSNGPRTTSAINDYIWNVEDSDLCIFIIDNKDGVTKGVQNEIDAANRNNIKSIYYFCSQFSHEKTQLQISLTGPGKPKYNEVESFEELIEKGTQNLIDEIIATYHNYCKGRLREYNGEIEISSMGVDIVASEKVDERFLPKVSLNNIDKSCMYIISKTIEINSRDMSESELKTSVLDDCELNFLKILMGEQPILSFSADTFFEELQKLQDPEHLMIVKLRWNAILAFFKDDIDSCIIELEKAYEEAESKKVSTWILQDILIDIRNIRILKGNIANKYFLEAQDKLDKFDEQFHYPVLDRINVTIREKYIKGLYTKKIDSPYTVYFGGDYTEYGQLFASAFLIAMYNGSLTHIRLFFDRLKEFMFYFTEKYSDWASRKNLIKYAIVSASEKEIEQIVNAYPEILNSLCAEDAEEIMRFSEVLPIANEKIVAKIKAFGVVGYYLTDEVFAEYEKEIVDTIFDNFNQDNVSHLLGGIVFKNLKKVTVRMSSDRLIEICLLVMKKGYSSWYRDMFRFIERIDLTLVTEELRKRLILAFEELLYEEKGKNFLLDGILIHIRNCDRCNTERLDSILKEKYPQYYDDLYLLNTCGENKQFYLNYITKLENSIQKRNETQGKGGVYSGYAQSNYDFLLVLLGKYVMPDDNTIKDLLQLAKHTICESQESVTTKIDAVKFIIMLLGKRTDLCNYFKTDIDEIFEKRDRLDKSDLWNFSNVEPIALEFGIVLLKSMVSEEDEYYELIKIIALVDDNTATKISIVNMLKNFYEQKNNKLSSRIETALLSNVLQWLGDSNIDIRWNACNILFELSQRLIKPELVANKLIDLMEHDCGYIKILIIKNLADIHISDAAKKEIFRKADNDSNYLVRIKSKQYWIDTL